MNVLKIFGIEDSYVLIIKTINSQFQLKWSKIKEFAKKKKIAIGQGHPFSPLQFNIVFEILARISKTRR